MALAATTICEVESGGSDTANGGMFDPGQSAGMLTDGTCTLGTGNAPVFASASYSFVSGDVNAWLFIASGTNWTPGWYKITSVDTTGATSATLDATLGHGVLFVSPGAAGLTTVAGCATVATQSTNKATWSIDYSQQAGTRYAFTYSDLSSTGNGLTVSSAAKPFAKPQVGNSIVVTGGTNFTAGRYIIASISGTTATVLGAANIHTAAGTNSDGTGGQGGAFASPGKAWSVAVAGMDVFIQSGSNYTVTSASSNVAAGCMTMTASSAATNASKFIGYQTYRGDRGTKPIVKADSVITTFTLCTMAANTLVENIEWDGNSRTSSRGINSAGANDTLIDYCTGRNFTNSFVVGTQLDRTVTRNCYATTCSTTSAFLDAGAQHCVAYANTFTGFQLSGNRGSFTNCISASNTGGSSVGFNFSVGGTARNCVAYGNGSDGFAGQPNGFVVCENCISESNSGLGFNTTGCDNFYLYNCAAHGNSTNYASDFTTDRKRNCLTLTSDPFTASGSQDFSLNATASAGASCRAAGILGAFPTIGTTAYQDIGAVQHRDAGISRAGAVNG